MSTYAQRVQLGPFFLSGVLQGAAKLYHYEAGTSTLKNIWSDRGMGTTLAQPFVADADGVFNFFADGLYKLIICGPDSTGPSDDVLYTLDNWQLIDRTDPTFSEGSPIASASAIAVGPEIFAHVTGSTNINTISGTIPFVWLVFDGNLTLVHSASLLCPGSVNLSVQAGDVLFLLNEGSNVFRVAGQLAAALQVGAADVAVVAQDTRTNTVDAPFTVTSTTSGTPAAGIGVGILCKAESADENPSNFGQLEFVATDVTAGSEDTYFQVLLRRAGAALAAAYRWVATTAYMAIFTNANTADRTYTLPDRTCNLGIRYDCPTATGTGSTQAHEGSQTISSPTNLSGTHFYTDFTLNNGVTLTVPANEHFVAIYATGTITIRGTIAANSGGVPGGSSASVGNPGNAGTDATDQPGGNGGSGGGATAAGSGGDCYMHGFQISSGNTQLAGDDVFALPYPMMLRGGAGGGSGGGGTGAGGSGAGGRGGATVILIAPKVVLAATATINTSGGNGGNAAGATGGGGGGGGGAGNLFILTHEFTDSGATITQNGGSAGAGNGAGNSGQAGANGIKQINIY